MTGEPNSRVESLATIANGYNFEASWADELDPVNFATSPPRYTASPPGTTCYAGGDPETRFQIEYDGRPAGSSSGSPLR